MRSNIEILFETNDLVNLNSCNYYDLLGVNKNAVNDAFSRDLKKQYRQLALRFHPDCNQGDKTKAEIFKLINEAYSTLVDAQKRREYDEKLNEEVSSPTRATASFFHAPQQETPPLPSETYCFFYTQRNDWHAFGWEADITVLNKPLNVRFSLSGHILPVKCLIFSSNGRYLASADMNNVIKIWDLDSQQCLQSFTATTSRISHLFFSENNQWLLSGEENQIFESTRKIEVWDFKNGKHLGVFSGFYELSQNGYGDGQCIGCGVTHLAISPEGRVVPGSEGKIATTQCQNEIIVPIWPETVAKPIHMYGYEFNAAKSHVLVREKLAVTVWNLETQTLVVSLKATPSEAQTKKDCRIACAFNPINETFALGIGDVHIVDYHGRLQQKLSSRDVIDKLMYTPDGKFLISQGRRSIAVHDCETEKSYCLPIEAGFDGITISADSQKMLVIPHSRKDCMVEVYEVSSGKRLFQQKLQYDGVKDPRILNFGLSDVNIVRHAFSKNCQTIALGLSDNSIRLIDANTFEMTILRGHRNWVIGVAFSPDNQWLVTTSRDNTICVWDYKERTLKERLSSGYSEHIIFVDDHRFLFVVGKQIKIWDIATRQMDDVCRLSFREKLYYADHALFFEDERGRLTKTDISGVLNKLDNPSVPASACGV